MASATRLNAASSIINNTGLSISPRLTSAITTFQNQTPLQNLANAYVNTGITANVTANLVSLLDTVGTGVTKGWFLLDIYPPNIAPVASANLKTWTAGTSTPTGDLIRHNGRVFKTIGSTNSPSFDANVVNNCVLKGFSEVINLQAGLPFKYTLSGFANVYMTVYGFINQGFDSVSSASMLKNTTYSQSGVGYSSPTDLVTNGIGPSGKILANVVSNFGTMYDIRNISKLGDPYVFGQNLLDQGFGYLNNMEGQFSNLGLDTRDITRIPSTTVSTTQTPGTIPVKTSVGIVEIPSTVETTTAVVARGSSPDVITAVLETVTGANLSSIISATNVTVSATNLSSIITLKDFLDLKKVVNEDIYNQLRDLGISTFNQLGKYLANKTSPGRFADWPAMSKFFRNIEVPSLNYMSTGPNAKVLISGTSTTINNQYGSGTGRFENPTVNDFFGAAEGNPYAQKFELINQYYAIGSSTLNSTTKQLDNSVIDYCNQYAAYEASYVDDGMGGGTYGLPEPSISIVTSNVSAVNTALNNLAETLEQKTCDRAVYQMLNKITQEVNNLQLAHVNFDPSTPQTKKSLADSIHMMASDKDQFESYQFFANIITNDIPGDTIRATIAEYINESVLATAGINFYNDPDPAGKIREAKAQNQSLTTYISRNK